MPNHLHAAIALNKSHQTINTIISNGKRFMAYEIVKRLELQNERMILYELSKNITLTEPKKGQLHKVFEPSFDIKICNSYDFIEQKLKYMHNNPCSKKWMLVQEPIDYKHSSMRFYSEYNESTSLKWTAYTEL
jgi:hypothetical protein